MANSRVRFFKVFVFVASAYGSLVCAEFFLAFVRLPLAKQRVQAAKHRDIEFDTRSKFEFINDKRAEGEAVITHYPPGIAVTEFLQTEMFLQTESDASTDFLPLAGVSNIRTVTGNENGYFKMFKSDRFGFNNPQSSYEIPIDVVLIGDSFTMGNNVRSTEDIAGQLRSRGLGVLNLGYGATGPLVQLATLVEYASDVKPKTVLWFFFEGNDFFNLRREQQHPLLMRYVDDPSFRQELRQRQREIDRLLSGKIETAERLEQARVDTAFRRSLVDRLELTGIRSVWRSAVNSQSSNTNPTRRDGSDFSVEVADLDLLERVLARASKTVATWGGEIELVYLPDFARFGVADARESLDRRRQSVCAVANRLGLRTIDVAATFEESSEPQKLFPFELPGHYNAAGYRLVAETVQRSTFAKSVAQEPKQLR